MVNWQTWFEAVLNTWLKELAICCNLELVILMTRSGIEFAETDGKSNSVDNKVINTVINELIINN